MEASDQTLSISVIDTSAFLIFCAQANEILVDMLEMIQSGMGVEIIESFEDVTNLRNEWDAFVESLGGDIYLTFDWCRIWWRYYGVGRELRIFLCRAEGRIVGLLPMFVETLWLGPIWMRVAKIVGSDFTTSMVNLPVRDEHANVIYIDVVAQLVGENHCDVVCFGPLGGGYPAMAHLVSVSDVIPGVQLLRNRFQSPYSVFTVPDSFDEYVQSLEKRQRGNLRRDLSLAKRELAFAVEEISEGDWFESEWNRFVEMHTVQWKHDGKQGHFNDWPSAFKFNLDMAKIQLEQNRLRFLRLRAKDEVIGYELCYEFGKRWHWRLPARLVSPEWDRYGIGRLGLSSVVDSAIKAGAREVEAGAGHYDYKVKMGASEFPLENVLLIRGKWFSFCRAWTFMRLSGLLHFGYYRVWFLRLAPRLPFQRRPLWKAWIRTRF